MEKLQIVSATKPLAPFTAEWYLLRYTRYWVRFYHMYTTEKEKRSIREKTEEMEVVLYRVFGVPYKVMYAIRKKAEEYFNLSDESEKVLTQVIKELNNDVRPL